MPELSVASVPVARAKVHNRQRHLFDLLWRETSATEFGHQVGNFGRGEAGGRAEVLGSVSQ